jgi:hypothetical protein
LEALACGFLVVMVLVVLPVVLPVVVPAVVVVLAVVTVCTSRQLAIASSRLRCPFDNSEFSNGRTVQRQSDGAPLWRFVMQIIVT